MLVAACLLLPSFCQAYSGYDKLIKAYWSQYNPSVPWGLGWAQVKQESAFDCNAVSPVGAMGCAQFMPATWLDMIEAGVVPKDSTPFDTRYALEAQAYYMRTQFNGWQTKNRTFESWIKLGFAGYNAGRGNLYKAQKVCDGVMEYSQIMECLPSITGRHAKETSGYVSKITEYFYRRFGV